MEAFILLGYDLLYVRHGWTILVSIFLPTTTWHIQVWVVVLEINWEQSECRLISRVLLQSRGLYIPLYNFILSGIWRLTLFRDAPPSSSCTLNGVRNVFLHCERTAALSQTYCKTLWLHLLESQQKGINQLIVLKVLLRSNLVARSVIIQNAVQCVTGYCTKNHHPLLICNWTIFSLPNALCRSSSYLKCNVYAHTRSLS